MDKKSIKVGIFSFLALILFILGVLLTKHISIGEKGYFLNIRYNFVSDLREGSPVIFAGGLRIGFVKSIEKVKNELNVKIWINQNYKIDRNAKFIIFSSGMLGDKYIEVEVETPSDTYFNENEVIKGINPISIDGLSIKFGNMVNSLFGGAMDTKDIQKSFLYLFKNTSELMYQLNLLVKDSTPTFKSSVTELAYSLQNFRKELTTILESLSRTSGNIENLSIDSKESLKKSIISLEKSLKNIEKASYDLIEITENTKNITRAIKEQKGTVGKLIYDKKIYKNIEKTAKNLEIFSAKIRKNPKTIIW